MLNIYRKKNPPRFPVHLVFTGFHFIDKLTWYWRFSFVQIYCNHNKSRPHEANNWDKPKTTLVNKKKKTKQKKHDIF